MMKWQIESEKNLEIIQRVAEDGFVLATAIGEIIKQGGKDDG